MKKLVMFTEESVFSGIVKTSIAELVDGLAVSLADEYQVSVICPDGNTRLSHSIGQIESISPCIKRGRIFGATFYLVDQSNWPTVGIELMNQLRAEIFHNFSCPERVLDLDYLPSKTVLTFNSSTDLAGQEGALTRYDLILADSPRLIETISQQRNLVSQIVQDKHGQGLIPGVLEEYFSPASGRLIPMGYSFEDISGKQYCKGKLCRKYGLPATACLYLTTCFDSHELGEEYIQQAFDAIAETEGYLILVSTNEDYDKILSYHPARERVLFVKDQTSLVQTARFMAGADFYIQLCSCEVDGTAPLSAALYGAIPIISSESELVECLDQGDPIIAEGNNLHEAIIKASELFKDTKALLDRQAENMIQDFSWSNQKQKYIDLYEE